MNCVNELTGVKIRLIYTVLESSSARGLLTKILNFTFLAITNYKSLCQFNKNNASSELRTYQDVVDTLLNLGEYFYRAEIEVSDIDNYVKILLFDGELTHFFREYKKMISLLNDETITEQIFDIWLAGRREQLNETKIPYNPIPLLEDTEETENKQKRPIPNEGQGDE